MTHHPPARPVAPDSSSVNAAREERVTQPIYLSMSDLERRYAGIWSRWQLYEHVRQGLLPHVKMPGRRELLFPLADLERYESGEVELEIVKLPRGGRLCRLRKR